MPRKPKKPRPGEIFSAQTPPPEETQLDRALKRSEAADNAQREAHREGRPRSGEVYEAKSTQSDEQRRRDKVRVFLHQAIERFKLCAEAESASRAEALDDFEFRIGKQWPADIQMQRSMDGRPCLIMNRLPQFIRQITNEQRQQRPAIQVNPVGDGADTETAEILQGMIRHIEVNSDAEIAYDTGFDHAVTGGKGFWRVITEYIPNDDSFDQEIKIKRIKNPFMVYVDPAAIEADYSDARFCFLIEDLPISTYKDLYKGTEAAGLNDFTSIGDQAAEWATRDTIRIAEYFYIEETQHQLVQLDDGEILDEADIPEGDTRAILKRRTKLDRQVFWSKINAVEIIEGNEEKTAGQEWPGYWIPVPPVLGDDLDVNGKRYTAGMVRNAKDPQRMYNYWVSAGTEMIALAPRAPFIGAEGQFEGHEAQWAQANVRNMATLEYKPQSVGGTAVPVPQRQVYEPPVQSINLMTRQADNDLKATTGIYDASLGERGPAEAGKAILARQKQSDIATLNYSDNLARSIRHTGRILLDLIPHIYDAPRVQRIINPDNSVKHVGIYHSGTMDQAAAQQHFQGLQTPNPIDKIYDIGVGRYDVTISVGPAYQSKRQEAAQSIMALIQAFPQIMAVAGDLLLGEMDWNGAKELSKRLKKTLPPQLQDENDQDPEAQVQRLTAQLQGLMQQHEQITQALNQANEVIRTKRMELESKERIDAEDNRTKIVLGELQAKIDIARLTAQNELQRLQVIHDSAHEAAMQSVQQSHEMNLAEAQPVPQPAQ